MINLIFINIAIVFLIDQSGFINEFKRLKKVLTKGKMSDPGYSLKPFDCSLCMTFWVSLIYLLVFQELTGIKLYVSLFKFLVFTIYK